MMNEQEDVNGAHEAGLGPVGDSPPQQKLPPKKPNHGGLGEAAHPFDQTNGIVEGLEGDSNGFAEDGSADPAVPIDDADGNHDGDDSDEHGALPLKPQAHRASND